ncbi:MAG: molybdopterin cofactor-binding domain-containing protein, partial [Pseudomonadota bacterium]
GHGRGAVALGIGAALLEQHLYDDQAQQLTGTLQDYLVPGIFDVPEIDIIHTETPSPYTPGGHKGVGESGIIGAPAAIASAVADALDIAPTHIELPLTPERILALLESSS